MYHWRTLRFSVLAIVGLFIIAALTPSSHAAPKPLKRLSVAEYQDKVYAAWLGQIIGNIYGLSYEFRFIDQPGPDQFPYGFGPSLEKVKQVNGAFSDDDTDIEYMYLLQMEQHGFEPTYRQLAKAWQHHVRDKVWVANRNALTLMHAGYSPPLTGSKRYNPNWFQIDPQLVNEIWAVTAPGMLSYATGKSAWAARITNDDFGIEPTVHYAAMYAVAFFESDIATLIDIGTAALPPESRFGKTVEHMKALYRQYPDDWQTARQAMAKHYFKEFDYNRGAWTVVDANLNGACAILALLYGQGDFQRTLDIASGLGFDADNQAATMSGLLAIIGGTEALPNNLLYPLGQDVWEQPFNDRYINVSRYDLPDASLRDIAKRTAEQGEQVIINGGGKRVADPAGDYYLIAPDAAFHAPLELPSAPTLNGQLQQPFEFDIYPLPTPAGTSFQLVAGDLPQGLTLHQHQISGMPTQMGEFPITIALVRNPTQQQALDQPSERVEQDYFIRVYGTDLAQSASAVLTNKDLTPQQAELLRQPTNAPHTLYNQRNDSLPKIDYYGYRWAQPQTIDTLIFNPGNPQEFGGWLLSLDVQYLDENVQWQTIPSLVMTPPMNFDNSQWLKGSFIEHTIEFSPVTTTAIRIIGYAGGIEPDAFNESPKRYYSAAHQLKVYRAQ
ncbi:ADP-ribosylglycohydrolase family protein [Neiella marina]|uniref:ADP-ribosylglycohydrolase family protein n=1 Tax=Neiella holothuriorum TaxID=2870530 RepID=A0ABS7EC01_9GAMM|nr:ADP-ribosylglycohydrolase family protein [Neiella holothuriorum]MBW8189858.1 ADP-ribosylglycohydrolase family protein [Neiella holothuriorum]